MHYGFAFGVPALLLAAFTAFIGGLSAILGWVGVLVSDKANVTRKVPRSLYAITLAVCMDVVCLFTLYAPFYMQSDLVSLVLLVASFAATAVGVILARRGPDRAEWMAAVSAYVIAIGNAAGFVLMAYTVLTDR